MGVRNLSERESFGYSLDCSLAGPGAMNKTKVLGHLKSHGYVLLKNTGCSVDQFQAFTDQFFDKSLVHGAPFREKISADGVVKSVNPGNNPIVLHSELRYTPFSPDLLCFYCDVSPTVAGETTIADGELFYLNLSERAKTLVHSKKIKYRVEWNEEYVSAYFPGQSQSEVIKTLTRLGASDIEFPNTDSLSYWFVTSAIVRTYGGKWAFSNNIAIHEQYRNEQMNFQRNTDKVNRHECLWSDGASIEPWFFDEIMAIENKIVCKLQWQDTDFIMIDNIRVMHGRMGFPPGTPRKIYLRVGNLRAEDKTMVT